MGFYYQRLAGFCTNQSNKLEECHGQQAQSAVSPCDGLFVADLWARDFHIFSVNTGFDFLGITISPFVSLLHKRTAALIISQLHGWGYFSLLPKNHRVSFYLRTLGVNSSKNKKIRSRFSLVSRQSLFGVFTFSVDCEEQDLPYSLTIYF